MSSPLHIIIAGAGIGGLTAALALLNDGHRVTLIERAPELGEVGAGLQLSPNATHILKALGVLGQVSRHAMMPDYLTVRRGRDGAELMKMPLGAVAESRWRAPSFVIHRADLQKVLMDAVLSKLGAEVVTGTQVLGFAATSNGIQVGARQGDQNIRFDGDMLVGADGLHSAVRGQLGLGEADAPIYSGRTAWRALLPADRAPQMALNYATNLWLGSRAHLVHYPLREAEVVNIVAIVEDNWRGADESAYWFEHGDSRQIRTRFSRWDKSARALIDAVEQWRRWPLFDRNPVSRWSLERVVLLGDAAHPVLPFLAQGACLAIEDAGVLASALTRNQGNVDAAISTYEERRITRAAEIRIASRRQGSIYHMSGLPAMARDMVMRRMPRNRFMARMDWVYRYQV
ncbi:MAG: FAD-dependent monooxygenase [Hyphomicrobiales bacterium]|nr:FAD-dependent monooxygenase [Hyphomicrobiales bacterium]